METSVFQPEAVARLVGLRAAYKDNVYALTMNEFLIGRAPDCNLMMDEKTVSGHHARIVRSEGQFEIRDLGSTNGTYVNGVKIERKKLRHDDTIRIDQVEFRFLNPADASRTEIAQAPDFLAKTEISDKAATQSDSASPGDKKRGSLLAGLLIGVLIAYLLGFGVTFLNGYLQTRHLPQPVATVGQLAENLAAVYPQLHLHTTWAKGIKWSRLADVLPLAAIFIGLLLGGLLTQSLSRGRRLCAVFSFSVLYVAIALVLQLAALRFNFASWPRLFPSLAPSLSPWINLGATIAYFFGVVFVISGIGALLGKKRSL